MADAATPPTPRTPSSDAPQAPTRARMKAYFPTQSLPYHLHVLPEHRLAYVKNPKAACSTVLLWLDRLHTGEHDFSPGNVHKENRLPKPGEIGWPTVTRLLGGEAYRFTFVRDPLRRFESAYRDKVVKQRPWRPLIRKTLGLPPEDRTPITFEMFLSAVEQQDPIAEMDPHWRPQHVNLMHPLVTYDRIGRLETFAADLAKIRDEAGLPDVPFETRNVAKPAESSVYDGRPDLVRRVQAVYATDYEIYGY